MSGPKRNEGATLVGERTGTRATARYVRVSAYKAREVLDLIRGLDVRAADEVLQFTERDVAIMVRKVLASAVANAVNNDELDADELYVRACYADEGPTLKRFRPRARGRASRIRKRTTHITIVVDVLTDAMRARRDAKEAARPTTGRRVPSSAAAARRARVERSRAAAAQRAAGSEPGAPATDELPEEDSDEVLEAELVGEAELDAEADVDAELDVDAEADVESDAETDVDVEAPYGPGSAAAPADGSQPEGYPIKGNADSMLYHTPESPHYGRTKAEVWFATEADAEAAGFSKPASQAKAEAAAAEDDDDSGEGAD